jgi:hypothetical protein
MSMAGQTESIKPSIPLAPTPPLRCELGVLQQVSPIMQYKPQQLSRTFIIVFYEPQLGYRLYDLRLLAEGERPVQMGGSWVNLLVQYNYVWAIWCKASI